MGKAPTNYYHEAIGGGVFETLQEARDCALENALNNLRHAIMIAGRGLTATEAIESKDLILHEMNVVKNAFAGMYITTYKSTRA